MWYIGGGRQRGRRMMTHYYAGYLRGLFDRMTVTERMLLRREMLALGYRQRVAAPKLQKGRRLIIHTGRGSDTLDHAELVRSILAMKYPNELIWPNFCIRCFRDLPRNRQVCTWCGFWNGGGNEPDMFWRPGGRKR